MNAYNELKAQAAYERAREILETSSTAAEARKRYEWSEAGIRKHCRIQYIVDQHEDLSELFEELKKYDPTYERAKAAIEGAESLDDARSRYGRESRRALRTAARRYPDLLSAYNALPGAGNNSEALVQAQERQSRIAEEKRKILVENVEDLLEIGASKNEIIRRVGQKTWTGLAMALRRAKRPDLVSRVRAV